VENITERKRQAERTAQIQRDLLPSRTPDLDGYELAAACLPVQDVTGDFYDWAGPEDGKLDLTVADVMGGGAGAALVMATLRIGLRTMARDLGPGARGALVAQSLTQVLGEDGPSVALFHARLDL